MKVKFKRKFEKYRSGNVIEITKAEFEKIKDFVDVMTEESEVIEEKGGAPELESHKKYKMRGKENE